MGLNNFEMVFLGGSMSILDPLLAKEVEEIASKYTEKKANEIEDLFLDEWWMSTPRGEQSTEKDDKFWKAFKTRLIVEILKNRDVGSVTLGFVTSQVLNGIINLGIDLTAYKIPVAILVALIARSIWDTLDANLKE